MGFKLVKEQHFKEHGHICYFGGNVNERNVLTLHHLEPRRLGGQDVYVNTALIARLEHDIVHAVEREDEDLYQEFTDYLHYFRDHHDLEKLKEMREKLYQWLEHSEYEVFECKGNTLSIHKKKCLRK